MPEVTTSDVLITLRPISNNLCAANVDPIVALFRFII